MCEILVCVKDRDPTNPKAPQQGDVIFVAPDGWQWGTAELGGPNYERVDVATYSRDVVLLVKNSVDLTQITDPRQLVPSDILSKSVGALTLLQSDVGLPDFYGNFVVSVPNSTVSFTAYDRVVTGKTIRPISEHPNGNHNFLRVIKLPNVTEAQASNLLTTEIDADPQNPNPNLQYRGFFLDKTKFPTQAIKNYWNDDARTAGFITLNLTAAQIQNFVSKRPIWGS